MPAAAARTRESLELELKKQIGEAKRTRDPRGRRVESCQVMQQMAENGSKSARHASPVSSAPDSEEFAGEGVGMQFFDRRGMCHALPTGCSCKGERRGEVPKNI
jgi:hypothetical protein